MSTNEELAISLRRAAHTLTDTHSIRDLDQTLAEIVAAAVNTVGGADAGGISTTTESGVSSRNPSTETVTKLDGLQSELREGPCISAMENPPDDGAIVVVDLGGEDAARWPRFAPQAVTAGFRAMISLDLHTGRRMRSALNLYAAEPDAFDDEARLTAALFGVQAAMLLYGSEQAAHLQRAVDSRDVIGQAKGILIERFHLTGDQAFQMLVRSSQDTNMKVVDVAQWLLEEALARNAGHDGDGWTAPAG
ncbi:GAF and ANTAR domain-containing protein [Actinomycetospora sp. TBRC 11914]|uniref:GAF and ANTAR domain-containing protein n=1 Tax=Actinomycetospora sp. TBRC 11914 TaxID=2729387 RepID=UPI00145E6C09|nr:GAF and ANTAR domain-containing protein [Actinomycetospora sp. TBRC 11914]NMO90597.1 ANTAR domain-containing protein [Actinomycetospora sp. TBRC 11914]